MRNGSTTSRWSFWSAAPWAMGFVGLRMTHITLYLLNLDILRSIVFAASMVCLVRMIALAA